MSNKKPRQALGRGLSSLIPVFEEEAGLAAVVDVAEEKIAPNPFQPRRAFDEEEIKGLAESIKSQGLLQPVILRKKEDFFEIISGERRVRALRLLGEKRIPAIIKDMVSDTKMLEMALVENVQRENLNDIELAQSYQKLLFDCRISHQDLSGRIGKSRSAITNTLRLLKLPQEIQAMICGGEISSGHARALLSLKDQKSQIAVAQKIVAQQLSVRQTEHIVQPKGAGRKSGAQAQGATARDGKFLDPETAHQQDLLRYRFGTDVRILMDAAYRGKVEIHFYNKEDCHRILKLCNSKEPVV